MQRIDPMDDAAWWFIELITTSDVNLLWPEFEKWLRTSPDNRRAYETVEHAWSRCEYPRILMRRRQVSFTERAWLH